MLKLSFRRNLRQLARRTAPTFYTGNGVLLFIGIRMMNDVILRFRNRRGNRRRKNEDTRVIAITLVLECVRGKTETIKSWGVMYYCIYAQDIRYDVDVKDNAPPPPSITICSSNIFYDSYF